MRQNAPADRLEDLFITVHEDRLIKQIAVGHGPIAAFGVHARYGRTPLFDEEKGAITIDSLELIFSRGLRRRPLILPVTFEPFLTIETKDLGDMGIVRAIKTLALAETDTKLFGCLLQITQLSFFHILTWGPKLAVHISYRQRASETAFLNEMETQWLLDL